MRRKLICQLRKKGRQFRCQLKHAVPLARNRMGFSDTNVAQVRTKLEQHIKIAIDFDNTYTLDPLFWDRFIAVEKILPVIYTRGVAKHHVLMSDPDAAEHGKGPSIPMRSCGC